MNFLNYFLVLVEKLFSYIRETWWGKEEVETQIVRRKTKDGGWEVREVPILGVDGSPKKKEIFPGRKQGFWGRLGMLACGLAVIVVSGWVLDILGGSWLFRVLMIAVVGAVIWKEWKNWSGLVLFLFLASGLIFYPVLAGVAVRAKWSLIGIALAVFLLEELFDRGFQHNWYPRWVGIGGIILAVAYLCWGVISFFSSPQWQITAEQVLLQEEQKQEVVHYIKKADLSAAVSAGKGLMIEPARPEVELAKRCLRRLYFGAYFFLFFLFFMIIASYEMAGDLWKKLRAVKDSRGGKFSITDYFSLEVAGEVVRAILEKRRHKK